MFYAMLLTVLAPAGLRVEGLHAGEKQVALGPAAVPAEPLVHGRVIDARTGYPVEGAWVETWTEEIDGPGMGFRAVGEAVTGRDGQFAVRVRSGGLVGDKVRVRAQGYLTQPMTASDLGLVRLMPAGPPTLLKVVDLAGDPIAGARITSTYSCSHDHPAFERRTDEAGRVELSEYGLQENTGDLRVRAAGYRAIEYLRPSRVLPDREMAERGEPAVVRLARSRSLRARVLGPDGRPLAYRALRIIDGDAYHVPFTDGEGRFEVLSTYDGSEVTIFVLEDGNEPFVYSGRLPLEGEVTLRVESRDFPDDAPLGRLVIEVEGDHTAPSEIPLQLLHEEGWSIVPRVEEGELAAELPTGSARLLVGGAFSGVVEESHDLELEPGEERRLRIHPSREPLLTVLTPPNEKGELIVQAGSHSTRVDVKRGGETYVDVPSGEALTLYFTGWNRRLLRIDPLESEQEGGGEARVDLRTNECMLLPDRFEQVREMEPSLSTESSGLWRAVSGIAVTAGEGSSQSVEVEFSAPYGGERRFVGEQVLLHARSRGFAELREHVWMRPRKEAYSSVLEMTQLAFLQIATDLEIASTSLVGETLDALHPGPLTLTLTMVDGRRVVLDLELEPGEARTLRLFDE